MQHQKPANDCFGHCRGGLHGRRLLVCEHSLTACQNMQTGQALANIHTLVCAPVEQCVSVTQKALRQGKK